ncbi:hypothetical protein [Nocardia arthritidis]|uniref:Uncharacterized protein n=1 Tax=Nocardia arthritidis TaxID=228602 RepID=A0A6G9YQT1_9NOCA|nr:hypothetical protein [Nocardia arthritidis]QIS15665.1 hypothetical protein F5544_39220 [Nocardia arthritidis]
MGKHNTIRRPAAPVGMVVVSTAALLAAAIGIGDRAIQTNRVAAPPVSGIDRPHASSLSSALPRTADQPGVTQALPDTVAPEPPPPADDPMGTLRHRHARVIVQQVAQQDDNPPPAPKPLLPGPLGVIFGQLISALNLNPGSVAAG